MALQVDEVWLKKYYAQHGMIKQLEALGDPAPSTPKPSKYHNQRTTIEGITFDSKREAERYQLHQLRLRAGEIRAVLLQVPFRLPGGVVYRADFVVLNLDGTYTVEDSKGVKTKEYMIKRKQMRECLGIEIKEV